MLTKHFFIVFQVQFSASPPPLPTFLKRFYLLIVRERRREGEREGEKHQSVVASCTPPTGDLAHSPGTCPDWESIP